MMRSMMRVSDPPPGGGRGGGQQQRAVGIRVSWLYISERVSCKRCWTCCDMEMVAGSPELGERYRVTERLVAGRAEWSDYVGKVMVISRKLKTCVEASVVEEGLIADVITSLSARSARWSVRWSSGVFGSSWCVASIRRR